MCKVPTISRNRCRYFEELDRRDQQALYVFKSNIASALSRNRQLDSAIVLYKSLIPLGIEPDRLFLNLGETYLANRQADSAIYYLSFVTDTSQWFQQINLRNQRAEAYLLKGNTEQAIGKLTYVDEVLRKQEPLRQSMLIGTTYRLLGQAYTQQNQLKKALQYYHKSIIQFEL